MPRGRFVNARVLGRAARARPWHRDVRTRHGDVAAAPRWHEAVL